MNACPPARSAPGPAGQCAPGTRPPPLGQSHPSRPARGPRTTRPGSEPRPAPAPAPPPRRPRPACRPRPLPAPARPRAALWELWSARPRGAQRGVCTGGGTGSAPARAPAAWAGRWPRGAGRGRLLVRALVRRRRPGPSVRPRRPRRPGAGKRRLQEAAGRGGLWGGTALPGGHPPTRERGRRRRPDGFGPAVPTPGGGAATGDARGRRRPPAPRIPARPRGPAARRSLRAERRRRAVLAAGRAAPSLEPLPHRGAPALFVTLLPAPFPCLLSPSPQP